MRTIKIQTGFFMIALSLLVAACGGGGPTPSEVTKNFLTALQDLNFEEAKKYATAESASMLDMMAGFAEMGEGQEEKPPQAPVKIVEEKIDGDNATVTYETKNDQGEMVQEQLSLVKVDGTWKVKFDKSSLGAGEMGDMMDEEPSAEGEATEEPSAEEPSAVDSTMQEMGEAAEQTIKEAGKAVDEAVQEADKKAQEMMGGGQN